MNLWPIILVYLAAINILIVSMDMDLWSVSVKLKKLEVSFSQNFNENEHRVNQEKNIKICWQGMVWPGKNKILKQFRTRISEGARIYDFNNHGKSQSLLHSNRQLFNKSHPMDTLNNIKRYQSEHGTYGAHPDERQHSMFNHLSQGFPFGSDLLRESFRR